MIIFARPHAVLMLAAFILAMTVVVSLFASLYLSFGTAQTFHYDHTVSNLSPDHGTKARVTFDCFGHQIGRADAIYMSTGTLTTAGTGSLTPKSDTCRELASVQMALDLGLLGFGIAGILARV